MFLQYARWFGFLYEYTYKTFWSVNINKFSFFFYCFNFLSTLANNPSLNKIHIFLYKKQQLSDKVTFFKAHTDQHFNLKSVEDLNNHLTALSVNFNTNLTIPSDNPALSNFTSKYKLLLSYWIFLKNMINSKKTTTTSKKITVFLNINNLHISNTKSFFLTPLESPYNRIIWNNFNFIARKTELVLNFF